MGLLGMKDGENHDQVCNKSKRISNSWSKRFEKRIVRILKEREKSNCSWTSMLGDQQSFGAAVLVTVAAGLDVMSRRGRQVFLTGFQPAR